MASETETAQISMNNREVAGPRYGTGESSWTPMEIGAKEGDSPVRERFKGPSGIPSTTGHVESRWNLGGPSPKAKYSAVTDSEPVPWGKGEKNPGMGVK